MAAGTQERLVRRVKIVLDTLGKLADGGYQFSLYCMDCRHSDMVTCESVAQRLGRDHSFYVVGKFRCSKCNGKNIEVRHMPLTAPQDIP